MTATKIFTSSIALILSGAFSTATVFADIFISNPWDTLPAFKVVLAYTQRGPTWSVSGSINNDRDGVQVMEKASGDVMRLFCADLFTQTSDNFDDGTGQVYHSTSLADSPFHSDIKKAQIQSLFDHVYTKAFNDDYSINNTFYAALFQFALWEITNDPTNNLSLRNGDLRLGNVAPLGSNGQYDSWDSALRDRALDTSDLWFYAILNDAWDKIGYDKDTVILTQYIAEGGAHVSQTFIGVEHSSVPEPATILVAGLGVAGLAIIRRLCKK